MEQHLLEEVQRKVGYCKFIAKGTAREADKAAGTGCRLSVTNCQLRPIRKNRGRQFCVNEPSAIPIAGMSL